MWNAVMIGPGNGMFEHLFRAFVTSPPLRERLRDALPPAWERVFDEPADASAVGVVGMGWWLADAVQPVAEVTTAATTMLRVAALTQRRVIMTSQTMLAVETLRRVRSSARPRTLIGMTCAIRGYERSFRCRSDLSVRRPQ